MKIRNGFVSNSSSSSFIVAFPSEPHNVKDVKKMMFGEKRHFSGYYSDEVYSTTTIAKTIFHDIKHQKMNDMEKMINSVSGGWNDFNIKYDDFRDVNGKIDWEKYTDENIKYSGIEVEKFINKNKDCVFYVFHYSDGDGSYYSTLEHGGIFDNLEHIRTSYH